MTSRRENEYQAVDVMAPDHLPACPDCHDLAHPSATICDGCGAKLFPSVFRCVSPEQDWIDQMRKEAQDG